MHAARGALAWLRSGERRVSKAQRQHRVVTVGRARGHVPSPAHGPPRSRGPQRNPSDGLADLDELGAIKVRVPGGETVYAIPEHPVDRIARGPSPASDVGLGRRRQPLAQSGRAGRTPPGSAHVVASGARPSRDRRLFSVRSPVTTPWWLSPLSRSPVSPQNGFGHSPGSPEVPHVRNPQTHREKHRQP